MGLFGSFKALSFIRVVKGDTAATVIVISLIRVCVFVIRDWAVSAEIATNFSCYFFAFRFLRVIRIIFMGY